MNDVTIQDNNGNAEHSYLFFGLGEKVYGVDVVNVLEVIKLQPLDVPQRLPKNIIGVMTYNDMAINVVDLRMVLALPIEPYTLDSQIIIVKTAESIFAVVADRAVGVFVFEPSKMNTLPYHSEGNLIKFLYKYEDDFASILDLYSIETVLQKTQFESNEVDITSLLPNDENAVQVLKQRQIQLAGNVPPGFNDALWANEQYIVFSLAQNLYAIDIGHVREIVNFSSVSIINLPLQYDYLEGLFSLKGSFISLLNLKKFLSVEDTKSDDDGGGKLIVLDLKDFRLALRVDDIVNIVTISNRDILGKTGSKFEPKYSLAEIYLEKKIITVLNLEKILSDEKLYIQA